jgi:diguanylate cyclase (GGDEF)-like protein
VQKPESEQVVFEHIRNAHREVITLYEIAQTIGTSLDLRDMFAVFASRLQDIVSYTTCALYLHKPNSIDVEAVHARGRDAERLKGASIILGSGITGWVVANRQPMYNCDPRLDFDTAHVKLDVTYRTVISVPLLKGDEALGALTLYSADLNAYEPDHLRLVEAVAKLAADAIANALHHKQAQTTALTDQVTGLPNARAMRLRFEREAAEARRHAASFALLMMDMDSFKRINDSLGHKAGDDALRQVARVLSNEMRPNDFLSRYAGDEFVCLVQTGPTEARELVHRLQRAVENTRIGVDGSGAGLGISIGWASFGVDGETIDEMLLAADRTMYADKLRRRPVLTVSSDLEQLQVDQSRLM